MLKRIALFTLLAATSFAQTKITDDLRRFVAIDAPTFALTHVKVIDGTGAAPLEDQTIVVANGKIVSIGASSSAKVPADAKTFDKSGYTVIPGFVGMHNHLYYTASLPHEAAPGFVVTEIPLTAPRLYLACGVTTMRTTGSIEPYTDLAVKHDIDAGTMTGPHIDLSAPYLEGAPGASMIPAMYELKGPDDARKFVDFYADAGFTSYKAYMHIKAADLKAAIDEAHKRHAKVTGHLCSVGYREAASLGIDNLEHGFFENAEFVKDKQHDVCPSGRAEMSALVAADPASSEVQALFKDLIDHHVAVTSTLPVFESGFGPVNPRTLDAMSAESKQSFLASRVRTTPAGMTAQENFYKRGAALEHAFFKAGGTLLAGPDPTGKGGVLPGFGDQRELELLVAAGFTPIEAIKIATYNGAQFEGILDHTGTVAAGKNADLVLIHGDPASKIEDIEKVETVFKDGLGWDSAKLIDSVKGQVGIR